MTTRAFLERVRDAAASLRVGPADDVATEIGPLIERTGEALQRGLTALEPGEHWLLRPEARSDDQRLWSPGIRIGVRPGSWFAPHRVLRSRARRHPRRRLRPRHPDPERQRVRAHGRSAVARPRRDRPAGRNVSRRETSTSTEASPARSCDGNPSAAGSSPSSARPQKRAARTTLTPSSAGTTRASTSTRSRPCTNDGCATSDIASTTRPDLLPNGTCTATEHCGVVCWSDARRTRTRPRPRAGGGRVERDRRRAPYGRTPPASQRPFCAHGSERSASTGSDSLATARRPRVTTSALLRMPPACRSTTRYPSVRRRSSYRGGCASSL